MLACGNHGTGFGGCLTPPHKGAVSHPTLPPGTQGYATPCFSDDKRDACSGKQAQYSPAIRKVGVREHGHSTFRSPGTENRTIPVSNHVLDTVQKTSHGLSVTLKSTLSGKKHHDPLVTVEVQRGQVTCSRSHSASGLEGMQKEFNGKTQLFVLPKAGERDLAFHHHSCWTVPYSCPMASGFQLGPRIFPNVDSHTVEQGGIHGIFLQLMVLGRPSGVSFPCVLQQKHVLKPAPQNSLLPC